MAGWSRAKVVIAAACVIVCYFLASVLVPTFLPKSESGSLPGERIFRRNDQVTGSEQRHLEIWSLTNAGIYLWGHILQGTFTTSAGGRLVVGEKVIGDWSIRFANGKDLSPSYIKADTEYLVLALNGRSEAVRATLFHWLDELRTLPQLKHIGLFLVGSEDCNNNWLLAHFIDLPEVDRLVSAVWMTYDHALVDGKRFFQWPLGVAAYRNFPTSPVSEASLQHPRPYRCNFLGTVYKGSTRAGLPKILEAINAQGMTCFVKIRTEWVAHEKAESMELYQRAVKSSDLTLCPVGKNAESYRIYEALSLGSVPVIEDVSPKEACEPAVERRLLLANNLAVPSGDRPKSDHVSGPHRLLKSLGAPVIYIKRWEELTDIIEMEKQLNLQQLVERRVKLLKWYSQFREVLAEAFLVSLNKMAKQD